MSPLVFAPDDMTADELSRWPTSWRHGLHPHDFPHNSQPQALHPAPLYWELVSCMYWLSFPVTSKPYVSRSASGKKETKEANEPR